MIQLHQLKPIHRGKRKKRIGRGGKRGGSSGFGVQHGGSSPPRIREILKRYPKLRGYRAHIPRREIAVVNVGTLESKCKAGETITPELLVKQGIIGRIRGSIPPLKILGEGTLTKAFTIEGCRVSKGAREKIEKVGGKIL